MRRLRPWLLAAGAITLSACLFAVLDHRGDLFSSVAGYLAVSAIGGIMLWGAWRLEAGRDTPRWLAIALAVSLALRLGMGFFLDATLPTSGNDSPHHRAGYFYPDAFVRDSQAWELASSGRPLVDLSEQAQRSDQYGGMLVLSALVYRLLSPGVHRPLLMVVLGATVSSLAVLFTWGLARRAFGPRAASVAAWTVALFPDAILLAASEMREPFVGTGLALALSGYARVRDGSLRAGFGAALAGAVLALVLSPPFGLLILLFIGLAWLWEGRADAKRTAWALGAIGALALLALVLTVRAWVPMQEGVPRAPLQMIGWWLSEGARFELYKLEQGSGWVQTVFQQTPLWAHFPLATLNGLVQPFLPAALADRDALPLLRLLVIWRALGWFGMLPFLLYAPIAATRGSPRRSLQLYLAVMVWATAIFISYRYAGDQWDSPRYRTAFLAAQAAVVGWAWAFAEERRTPWLRRAAVLVGAETLIFLHWDLGRYYHLPRLSLWWTLALGVAFAAIFLAGSMAIDATRAAADRSLTGPPREV